MCPPNVGAFPWGRGSWRKAVADPQPQEDTAETFGAVLVTDLDRGSVSL